MTEAEALDAARALIRERACETRHHVAATVLTASGTGYTATNLECVLPRAAICAEAIAIGMAAKAEPGMGIAFCVAVNRRGEILPPCGACRELLVDWAPMARIALPDGEGMRTVSPAELLPEPYKDGQRGTGGTNHS